MLLVRLDAIGDFILWIDAAGATVKHYKALGKHVVLVANVAWAGWAKELAIFDDVIAMDRHKYEGDLLYRFRLGLLIRKLKCSVAVHPTYSREFLFGDAVVRISGASERIGSTGDVSNITLRQKRISDRWYTRLIPAAPEHCMELVRNAEFVRGLGEIGFLAKVADLRAVSSVSQDDPFVALMPSAPRYYVLFPGASWDGRQWPVASFARVAERLYSKTGWRGVICGGQADRQLGDSMGLISSAPLINLAGSTDLPHLASILFGSQFLLTNETSAVHIAAALGVPTVCILGGGHYGRFMPYQVEQTDDRPLPHAIIHPMPCFGCNWHCIYKRSNADPVPCIERITEEQVWNAINKVLWLST